MPVGHRTCRSARLRLQQLAFSEFLQQLDAGGVTEVTFRDRAIDVTLRDSRVVQTIAPPEFLAANSSFVTDLVKAPHPREVVPAPDPSGARLRRDRDGRRILRADLLHGVSDDRRAAFPIPAAPGAPNAART